MKIYQYDLAPNMSAHFYTNPHTGKLTHVYDKTNPKPCPATFKWDPKNKLISIFNNDPLAVFCQLTTLKKEHFKLYLIDRIQSLISNKDGNLILIKRENDKDKSEIDCALIEWDATTDKILDINLMEIFW